MSPLAKVGGLGDVAGSLPRALRARGVDVRVAMPLHAIVDRSSIALERVAKVHVTTPAATEAATIWRTESHGVPVYLVEHD
jgi:starch synthase